MKLNIEGIGTKDQKVDETVIKHTKYQEEAFRTYEDNNSKVYRIAEAKSTVSLNLKGEIIW